MNTRIIFSFLLALSASPSIDAKQNDYSKQTNPNARDILILTDWFAGRFDNEEQLWFEKDRRYTTPEEERHGRLHTMHRKLDLPDFGEHVFYVEEYKDNAPEDLVRQRLVIFSSSPGTKGIRMQQGFFKKPEKATGAYFEPKKLAKLKDKDVFFINECDVFWQRKAGQFEGQMQAKACVFGEGEKRRYSVHNLILSADKYWRVDTTRLVSNDSIHVGHAEDNPHQMRKAKSFECEASVRKSDNSIAKYENISTHSQGGIFNVERGEDKPDLIVRMRDKQYPFYGTRPDFIFLSVREEGTSRSLVYGIHDIDSRRLGVNFDGIGIHCHRTGYDFRQSLDQL